MARPNVLSGIQPSGRMHIGNYLGMLKQAVELQNTQKYHCYYCIVDLHSITENFDPKRKQAQLLELVADMVAIGLSPKKSVIFQQSLVPAHSELAWIFNTITPVGEAERMTQFKDKASHQGRNINLGLLTYPTLMAADILLYDPPVVPVGDDQSQHLELTRTIARRFNAKFGKTFVEPRALLTKASRIMSLKDPLKKMSKSQPETCLFLDDSPNEIERKIKSAVTDSESHVKYNVEKKPGISNLLNIYSGLTGTPVEKLERQFVGKNYGEFKAKLIGAVIDHFAPFRKKKAALMKKPAVLKRILTAGSKKANVIANKKIAQMKRAIGIAL